MTVLQHKIPPCMVASAWRVVVVGAGGTGSALLPNLARLHHAMLELGHPGGINCTVYDDDTVSETNVGRQGFYPADIGGYKALLLVNRLNTHGHALGSSTPQTRSLCDSARGSGDRVC